MRQILDNTDKLNRFFSSKVFSKSDVDSILKNEEKILTILRNKKNKSIYDNFDNDISTFLSKLPPGHVKTHVQNLLNRRKIYIGVATTKQLPVFSRVLVTDDMKLGGICLVASFLDIDPVTGSTTSPDSCTYASYFAACRAACIVNNIEIKKNKNIHKLASTYLMFLFLRIIGPDKIYTEKQKSFIHLLSIYIYHKYYLKEHHSYILSLIEREYDSIIDKSYIKEFMPTLEKMDVYNTLKDFPRMMIDAKLYDRHPNAFIVSALKMLKPTCFYFVFGTLDYFLALFVTAKYPFEYIPKICLVNQKIHTSIEEIINKYLNTVEYVDIESYVGG